jgi:hypothetical protein
MKRYGMQEKQYSEENLYGKYLHYKKNTSQINDLTLYFKRMNKTVEKLSLLFVEEMSQYKLQCANEI